jgi:hypothetical protein
MDDTLPTDLLIDAQRRLAAAEGVAMVVVQRGDAASGSICLKVNTLDGLATVYSRVRVAHKLYWSPAPGATRVSDREADRYMARQADFDPDLWLIEVEDKAGRLWFPGSILDADETLDPSSALPLKGL